MAYFDEKELSFTEALSGQWEVLQKEYLDVAKSRVQLWHDAHLNAYDWSACVLKFGGRKNRKNWNLCKETARVLEDVPGLVTAGYFVLAPNSHLPAHRNYPRDCWRCHLGIVVPEGSRFRVEDETRPWEEGKWLVFDPNNEHEAWNTSDQHRVILLLDVWKDPENRPVKDRVFNRLDSYRYAMAQNPIGKPLIDMVGNNTAFRRVTGFLMGGQRV